MIYDCQIYNFFVCEIKVESLKNKYNQIERYTSSGKRKNERKSHLCKISQTEVDICYPETWNSLIKGIHYPPKNVLEHIENRSLIMSRKWVEGD